MVSDRDTEERYAAAPPITVDCRNCGEKIYWNGEKWYHVNSGSHMCRLHDEE